VATEFEVGMSRCWVSSRAALEGGFGIGCQCNARASRSGRGGSGFSTLGGGGSRILLDLEVAAGSKRP
jgi:hypothetical protein